jgi:intracellular sulfur oxidation DsrE/DsrF family protein
MIDKICPKCNGTGVVEVFGPMLIMSIAQDDNNNTMIVEFINYTSDDWINAVELMRDKKSVTILERKSEEQLADIEALEQNTISKNKPEER